MKRTPHNQYDPHPQRAPPLGFAGETRRTSGRDAEMLAVVCLHSGEENIRRGLAPKEARRTALARPGGRDGQGAIRDM